MSDIDLQTLLHEASITRALMRYAAALDRRDWDALAEVFTADAVADYQGIGEFAGLPAIVGVVQGFLDQCGPTQHLLGNVRIRVDGDQAQSDCCLQAVHAGRGSHAGQTMTVWGEYSDRLELRNEGWRIVHRRLSVSHVSGDVGVALKG